MSLSWHWPEYCKDAPLEISDFYVSYRWHLPHYEDPYAIEDELYFADRIDHIVETGKLKREYGVYRPIDRSSILSRSLLNWRAYVQLNPDLYGVEEFSISSDNPLKPFLKIPDLPF